MENVSQSFPFEKKPLIRKYVSEKLSKKGMFAYDGKYVQALAIF